MSRHLSPVASGTAGPAVALAGACGEAIGCPRASVPQTAVRAVGAAGTLDRDHIALTGLRAAQSACNLTQPVAGRSG